MNSGLFVRMVGSTIEFTEFDVDPVAVHIAGARHESPDAILTLGPDQSQQFDGRPVVAGVSPRGLGRRRGSIDHLERVEERLMSDEHVELDNESRSLLGELWETPVGPAVGTEGRVGVGGRAWCGVSG